MYRMVARAFGQHVNAVPFEILARTLPLDLLLRYGRRMITMESLFFGQAGLIPDTPMDYYSRRINRIYRMLQARHQLKPMDGHLWKYLRLRPLNFPGIRIAQLAWLIQKHPDLFSRLIRDAKPWKLLQSLEIKTSKYWKAHYTFGRRSRKSMKKPGYDFMHRLIINAVLPVYFSVKIRCGEPGCRDEWMESLQSLAAEDNHIIKAWKTAGLAIPDAFSSQAIIQLNDKYCKFRRCLTCYIGSRIIQP
jgi:hypothetical protein